MFNARIATTLVMTGIFGGALLMALALPTKAAFMPYLVGVPGLMLCLAQLLIDLRGGAELREKDRTRAKIAAEAAANKDDDARSERQMIGLLFAFTAVLVGFGFIIGGPLIVGIFVRFASRDTWINAIFAAAGTFFVLYGVFVWLLELTLFHGLILNGIL